MPKVSVIVPVYNVEKYLERCVESLLSQTFTDHEIILVDDGSKDNSGILCDDLKKRDDRIRVFHKENGGLSDARNYGVDNAKGEYIAFVDSDDYVSKDYLSLLVSGIENCGADVFQVGYYNVVNGVVDDSPYEQEEKIFDSFGAFNNLYGDESKYGPLDFLTWDKIYKKQLFFSLSFAKGLRCEDAIFTSEAVMHCKKIAVTSKKAYYYCRREDSIMGNMQKSKEDLIKSHILAYRHVAYYSRGFEKKYTDLAAARLAEFYGSALKNKMYRKDRELKSFLKKDRKTFKFIKNKRIALIKRILLTFGVI